MVIRILYFLVLSLKELSFGGEYPLSYLAP